MNLLSFCCKAIIKKISIGIYALKTNGRILSFVHFNTQLGYGVIIKPNAKISKQLKIIGRHTFIHSGVVLDFVSEIGAFCSISRDVKIGLGSHPKKYLSTSPLFYAKERGMISSSSYDTTEEKGFTIIEDDVLISANACILEGIRIGTGAIVGAGAVVTHDIPPYAIVAGIPAKIIGYRFDKETCEMLLSEKWWTLPLEEIQKKSKLWTV